MLQKIQGKPHQALMRRALIALFLGATVLSPVAALAQAWPSKPIRLIVNFPPGGAADQIARAIAQPLQEALGQPVIVDNRAGAGGNIGGDALAKSPPDGYTLLLTSGGLVSINPAIYPKMSFDPARDIIPVAAAARVLVFLEVRPSLPVKDVKAFIAYVKANPGKLSYGSPGNGTSPHLAGEMFKDMTQSFAVHAPYRGAAPAMQDLLGGQVDFMFDPGVGLNHVRAGKLRLLAVGSPKRSPLFPDVPTLSEAGLKGFDADTIFGFYAPAGTPASITARLNREINKILGTQAVKDRIATLGGEVAPMTPAEFDAKAHEDTARFGKLIKERHIMGD
ncbi:Bug family tripartite tricarboxylate transporter substrate binding protein [Polaromonas jejuensis]|uniref:Bug family tripartite tricarboxylate transporter substrate binding protein n=1 Tax=Polaromonas jejuensis TaxID=457502 RepID=A0ABW0QHU7_9BURK